MSEVDSQNPYANIIPESDIIQTGITLDGYWLREHMVTCPSQERERKQHKIDIVRLKQAEAESTNSNCVKHSVGCIITDAMGRILSSGYNGTPSNHKNCSDHFPNFPDNIDGPYQDADEMLKMAVLKRQHHEWSAQHEVHAEVNALLNSDPVDRSRGTLYVNLQPCEGCAKLIAASGVGRVIYGKAYHRANNEVSVKIFAASSIEYKHIPDII